MTIRNLDHLFQPRSVAILGASVREQRPGFVVMRNMLACGFAGRIFPVNPKYAAVQGVEACRDVSHLPAPPDLALIATPARTIPGLVAKLGAMGTRAAIVLTPGITDAPRRWAGSLKAKMLEAARPHLMRVLGPGSLGLLVPGRRLNASAAHTCAQPGSLAFVTQSGAIGEAVLDWARGRGIGFSKFVSLGDAADIDFGDCLDYLASDADTRAILLLVREVKGARKFMSAGRAAARNKPVVVLKLGRSPRGAADGRGPHLAAGVLAGPDEVFEAAVRRAGMLSVATTEELFGAVETLTHARAVAGGRLCVIANGAGPGVMAIDALTLRGGTPARLGEATRARLRSLVPVWGSTGNPVDIANDADADRHAEVLKVVLEDEGVDAVLVVHTPNALVGALRVAEALVPVASGARRNVLACWLGGDTLAPARETCARSGIASYDAPEKAVGAFLELVEHRRNQALLMEVPPSLEDSFEPDTGLARSLVRSALARGRTLLSEPEAKSVLMAYGIPVVATHIARSGRQAVEIAMSLGFPVVVKVVSDELPRRSEVGGVALELESAEEVRGAVRALRKRLRTLRPGARLRGFAVQRMVSRAAAQELLAGAATDPVFGPVVVFGQGGTAAEVIADCAIGLAPLNGILAGDLIARTRVSRLLGGYDGHPAVDVEALRLTLVKVSRMLVELPEIVELDINPLLADAQGVLALDARMRLARSPRRGADRMAIRPYPKELEEWIDWGGGRVWLRPIRPEDGERHQSFFGRLDAEDVRMRVFVPLRELQATQLARLTQIDYDREMAFVALVQAAGADWETLGVARAVTDPDNAQAEFAVIVRSDLKAKGLGTILMRKLIAYQRARGTRRMIGETLHDNQAMQKLATRLGFTVEPSAEPGVMRLTLELQERREAAGAPV
ncbi:MAG: bifunctional acetate--CoA ligase family protein/GNAT family N-acetyltransferase [Rhodocyclaceae bacterium]